MGKKSALKQHACPVHSGKYCRLCHCQQKQCTMFHDMTGLRTTCWIAAFGEINWHSKIYWSEFPAVTLNAILLWTTAAHVFFFSEGIQWSQRALFVCQTSRCPADKFSKLTIESCMLHGSHDCSPLENSAACRDDWQATINLMRNKRPRRQHLTAPHVATAWQQWTMTRVATQSVQAFIGLIKTEFMDRPEVFPATHNDWMFDYLQSALCLYVFIYGPCYM